MAHAFRCISGSVAVSAFELENMPLPSAKQMKKKSKHCSNAEHARRPLSEILEKFIFVELTAAIMNGK